MAPEDFHFLARLLRRRCGLSLNLEKMAMAERRLEPVMRRFHFRDMAALMDELRLGREALAEAVTETMTINESSFFRDPPLFDAICANLLPRLLAARAEQKRLRIWSAACAAGQEPYSIAIILSEFGLVREGWQLDIVATDLSADAIYRAESGRYTTHEIQRGLDGETRGRHFRRDGAEWVVEESLRRMVRFRKFNLLDSPGWLDDVDLVFCRNVLMYFNSATRLEVLERIADTLAADGALLLGESETPGRGSFVASDDGAGIYVKSRAALARAG